MDPIVEEILMARAMRDSQGVPDVNSAVTAGGIAGALGGAAGRFFASCSTEIRKYTWTFHLVVIKVLP